MQDGDPVEKTEIAEVENAEPVLSQEPEVSEPENQDSDPKGKTPEERFKNSQFAQTRIQNKEWRKHLVELRTNPKSLMEEAAKESGFDPSKEENKQHLEFQERFEKKKATQEQKIKSDATNNTIAETFKAMGIDPLSKKARIVGGNLYREYGIENPDIYQDQDLFKREMETIAEEFVEKRNHVNDSILRKASSSVPQKSNPKGASAPSEDKKIAADAAAMGVSPERYKTLIEKKKKVPKWAQ